MDEFAGLMDDYDAYNEDLRRGVLDVYKSMWVLYEDGELVGCAESHKDFTLPGTIIYVPPYILSKTK